ncbi:hypothetical protein predicted by Glimmer/Critica [Acetobacter ghanensis]|uniref:Uncharacterized protein n=1 Tax=Acetobacter ghanensis TaxID=431306 RepID=A0A0U4YBW1_9PROT|nr:hypothetical protein predicted by Glimmer/Critica [Acetobacter ghanensis]
MTENGVSFSGMSRMSVCFHAAGQCNGLFGNGW